MGRRIQGRLLLLLGLGAIGPALGLGWAAFDAQATFDRAISAERKLRAAEIAARVDDRLAAELGHLEAGAARGGADLARITAGRRSVIAATFLVDAQGHSAGVPAGLIDEARHDSAAAFQRIDAHRAWAIVPIRRWDGAFSGAIAAQLDLTSALHGAILSEPASGDSVHWRVTLPAAATPSAFSSSSFVFAGLAFAVSLLFAVGAARSVTRPLRALTEGARRMAAGDLATPVPPLPPDEVGQLGHALDLARRQLETRVAERTASVRRLLNQVIEAQEHERRRVARELHDETCQSLAALAMQLRAAGEDPLAARAEAALDALHRLIADLRPGVLDDLGLKSAISWLADRLRDGGVAVRCEFSGLDARLAPQVETTVFRAVQEAVHNIERHAHANSALIQAAEKDGALAIDVEDDGAGFDAAAFARPFDDGRGWGLLGMRERVEMLGGTLRVDSAQGQGTRVALHIPLG